MPELTIRYDDDSDRAPYAAIAAIVQAATEHLAVSDVIWTRDDREPGPPDEHTVITDRFGMVAQPEPDTIWRRILSTDPTRGGL